MAIPEIIDTLQSAGPFRTLPAKKIESLAAHGSRLTYSAGEYVWHNGSAAQYFMIVEQGLVAIQRVGTEGEAVLVALFGAGDALCIVPALQHMPFPADAVAMAERTTVLRIAAAPVMHAAESDRDLAALLNRALLDHTASLRSKIDIVSAGTVPRRIAVLLLHLAQRFGHEHAGIVQIRPAVTREQIGQLVNARTETVIRIMSRWSKVGWIGGDSSSLSVMQPDMLERIAYSRPGTDVVAD
jgi:CRP-like cAMP-binding protein